jgi:hypothetical protein
MAGDPSWLTIDCEGERRHVRLDLETTTIGRNEKNVIDLPDKRLSRFHCEIERRGEEYFLRDSGSKNGTKLNGAKVSGPIALVAGDAIEIGSSKLFFRVDRPIDADRANNLIPIAPVPKALHRATTILPAADPLGNTPEDAFDPRPTIPCAPPAVPPPPPPPPPPRSPRSEPWRVLAESIVQLAESATAEQVAARLAETALDLVPARQASVLVPTGPGAAPKVAAVRPVSSSAPSEPRYSSAVVEEALATGKAVAVADLKNDARWGIDYSVLGLDLRGVIAVPLRAGGRARGVLYLDDPRTPTRGEREDALLLLSAIADAAAVALVSAGGSIAADESRAASDAARAARLATEVLPPASGIQLALAQRPGGGGFAEVQPLPEHAGRRDLALLVALASGSALDAIRIEVATRTAFRALARAMPDGELLLAGLADVLGPELDGRTLRAAIFRLDPLTGGVKVVLAGIGPLLHRSHDGHILGLEPDSPALGGVFAPSVKEHAIAWEPGDLLLLAVPAPPDLAFAPWFAQGAADSAARTVERAQIELADSSIFLALGRG